MNTFMPTDILLPQVDSMEKWAVIACDQFTSQPEYWKRVRQFVGTEPSTLNQILPEAELDGEQTERINEINTTMKNYLESGIFKEYKNSLVYVERTLVNGMIRKGIIGALDLNDYDYDPDSSSCVRATEQTVIERIPPRVNIRKNAPLEFPHVLLLCDDVDRILIEPISEEKDNLEKLYEFDLMEDGGHIAGWLVQSEVKEAFEQRLSDYENKHSLLFAVGDGNHSLAAAKACYEKLKKENPGVDLSGHPARYALVELENIHDEAQESLPIHRILKDVDPKILLGKMKEEICEENGYPITWYAGKENGKIFLKKKKGVFPVETLQEFLDKYLNVHVGEIDYIHGDDELISLSEDENSIGFLLPPVEKEELFPSIALRGVLPRKTFSIGHAREKRYYLEGRKIQEL